MGSITALGVSIVSSVQSVDCMNFEMIQGLYLEEPPCLQWPEEVTCVDEELTDVFLICWCFVYLSICMFPQVPVCCALSAAICFFFFQVPTQFPSRRFSFIRNGSMAASPIACPFYPRDGPSPSPLLLERRMCVPSTRGPRTFNSEFPT